MSICTLQKHIANVAIEIGLVSCLRLWCGDERQSQAALPGECGMRRQIPVSVLARH